MNTIEVEQYQTLMNIVQTTNSDYLREAASRDHYRSRELSTVKASFEGSFQSVADSIHSLVCLVGPLQQTSVCAVPA